MKAVFADSFHFLALLNQNDLAHARAVLEHRRKWPGIVTTDCVSFLVMEDAGLTEALTADQHFDQAGFKALLK